ncbi:MAG: 1-deoxy-D-xylulose-5-phosphate reductoisomerase, partial [Prevotella sp.]
AFLEDRCSFPQMADIIAQTMQRATFDKNPGYDTYVATDAEARRVATELLDRRS